MKRLTVLLSIAFLMSCSKTATTPTNNIVAQKNIYQDGNITLMSVTPTMANSGANYYLQLNTTCSGVNGVDKVEFVNFASGTLRSTFIPKDGMNISYDFLVKEMPTIYAKQKYYFKIYKNNTVTESLPFEVFKD